MTKTNLLSANLFFYNNKFVARFKRGHRTSFINFLIKNFTVEEYFQKLEVEKLSPLQILESKGYLLPHVKRLLKENGYEISRTGLLKMIQTQVSARNPKFDK